MVLTWLGCCLVGLLGGAVGAGGAWGVFAVARQLSTGSCSVVAAELVPLQQDVYGVNCLLGLVRAPPKTWPSSSAAGARSISLGMSVLVSGPVPEPRSSGSSAFLAGSVWDLFDI